MQALGLVETKGLIASIESADVMTKSADVSILEKTYVGGGLVTVTVTGDVGAVKAAVDAAVSAVNSLGEEFLVSYHVIPRPHDDIAVIFGPDDDPDEADELNNKDDSENNADTEKSKTLERKEDEPQEEKSEGLEEKADENDLSSNEVNLKDIHKAEIDSLVNSRGIDEAISVLNKLKVVKLRNLAREYKDFGIIGRSISKADKNLLITKFKIYYDKL